MTSLGREALGRAVERIARGSNLVWERRSEALANWVRAGRRDDLTGWRAALGPAARLALLGAAGWLATRAVRAQPVLMWVVAAGWLVAAWLASRPASDEEAEEAPEDESEQGPAVADPEAVRALLLDLIGDARGVHLSTVLAHLQEHGQGEGWTVADLRVRLEGLGIPVDPKLKLGKTPTRGVRKADLLTPSPGAAEAASTSPSTAA